jgi:RNA polymerase sigma-70 factor (sigma-E family)
MGHTSVPEPTNRWAGAVRNRRLTPPGPAADLDAGTGGSVATLFREHHGELVRLAVLMVGDLPTAEDVVQDVYASMYSRRSQIAARDTILPYVRAAVLNGCRSVLRRRVIARRVGAARRDEPPAKSAESQVILSEDRRQVLAALARLPRRRREVLVLRYYLDLSEAEIAAVLRISPGTVKSTAARGLAALARDLGEQS